MSISAELFDSIAQRILKAHSADIPDLRNIIVLLPNLHVARPLAQSLMRVAQQPALLLPQLITLNEWAQTIQPDAPMIKDSQRSALLYQLLRDKKWFEQTDLWGMTQELLALFDELTHSLNTLPEDAEKFADAVNIAYQARKNSSLQLEARLVFELWHAMQSGTEVDAGRIYQQRLAKLSSQARLPLHVLRTSDWSSLEQRFLEQYAAKAEVTLYDLRMMQTENFGCILQVLNSQAEKSSLLEKASLLRTKQIPSLSGKLKFFAATGLEQEASAAVMQIRLWLQQGKREIAVVAQDRVAARRMRALLERAEILVTDETGWTFATLSVSTVLDRWLTALQSNFYHHDLLDLLKSPFIFAEMAVATRKEAVFQLEKILREKGVVAGLEKYATLAERDEGLHLLLTRLRKAASLVDLDKKKSLAGWLAVLRESLQVLAIDTGLKEDDAGVQLLNALEIWQLELALDKGRFRFSEWWRWLAQQLDQQTYRDTNIDSSVRFTHLTATRWRAFDAVLLLGCDADHLPSMKDGGRWFNDAVRGSLNLPTRSTQAVRQRDDLLALLTLNNCVLVTWQKERNGEAGILSPFLVMICDLHALAYNDNLAENELFDYLAAEEKYTIDLPHITRPEPSAKKSIVPEGVSISGYNCLVACPYQFYARYILRLNELDEVQEGIEKRDYGDRVHIILQRFHERFKQVSVHPISELEASLRKISEEVFGDLLQQNFAAQAWLARWFKTLPVYLEWQIENEKLGWRYAESESEFNWELESVRLRGRIDRLDVRGEEKRVLDYKTQSDQVLRKKLIEPGEDVQLACYAYAHEAADAAFVSIDNGKVKVVEPKQDVPQLSQLNAERLIKIMANIRNGAGLPANGIEATCEYCEMRGVCRKGEWI